MASNQITAEGFALLSPQYFDNLFPDERKTISAQYADPHCDQFVVEVKHDRMLRLQRRNPGNRGPTCHHWSPRCCRRSGLRRFCCLLAWAVDASHRRYISRPGEEEKDAFIIEDAARTMPHTLRSIQVADEDEATLGMLTGFDLDLSRQITQSDISGKTFTSRIVLLCWEGARQASIRFDPTSRVYDDRNRVQGKRHSQALNALAHRRLTVLFTIIRDGSLYDIPKLEIA